MKQFPINIANCRTVHKLQGRMLHNLVITAWCMGKGWPYVALSRVRTLKGVFLRKPLKQLTNPGLALDIRAMLQTFRRMILVSEDAD